MTKAQLQARLDEAEAEIARLKDVIGGCEDALHEYAIKAHRAEGARDELRRMGGDDA